MEHYGTLPDANDVDAVMRFEGSGGGSNVMVRVVLVAVMLDKQ